MSLPIWTGPRLCLGNGGPRMAKKLPKPEEMYRSYSKLRCWWSKICLVYLDQIDQSCWTNLLPLAQAVGRDRCRSTQGTKAASEVKWTNEKSDLWSDARQVDLEWSCTGKLLSPVLYSTCIDNVRSQFKVSERRVCLVLQQHRSTQYNFLKGHSDA